MVSEQHARFHPYRSNLTLRTFKLSVMVVAHILEGMDKLSQGQNSFTVVLHYFGLQ